MAKYDVYLNDSWMCAEKSLKEAKVRAEKESRKLPASRSPALRIIRTTPYSKWEKMGKVWKKW